MSAYLTERIKRLRKLEHQHGGRTFYSLVPWIECADGLRMSVQASETHYCSPRDNGGPWVEFEVGYPTQKVDALMPFAENSEAPTDTVYAFVPGHIIEQVIKEHGGEKA